VSREPSYNTSWELPKGVFILLSLLRESHEKRLKLILMLRIIRACALGFKFTEAFFGRLSKLSTSFFIITTDKANATITTQVPEDHPPATRTRASQPY
jgi:hypothetical protein